MTDRADEIVRKITEASSREHGPTVQRIAAALRDFAKEERERYLELVDALCSRSWMGRNRHAAVVALAKRLHDSQTVIRPLELEDVALAAGYCIRKSGHDGPCNGLPRNDCFRIWEDGRDPDAETGTAR